jgi:hypothetical protein
LTLLTTGRVGGTGANRFETVGIGADGKIIITQRTSGGFDDYYCKIPSTDVGDKPRVPTEFTLHGNYPNPFNPSTNVRFDLPEQAKVRIEVVDLLGRQLMKMPSVAYTAGSNKTYTIDAGSLSTGVYFYRIIAEGSTRTFIQASKFTLVK